MERELAPNEIMREGDRMLIKGELWITIEGLAGKRAGRYIDPLEGVTVVRPDESDYLSDLQEGLEKIRRDLWTTD